MAVYGLTVDNIHLEVTFEGRRDLLLKLVMFTSLVSTIKN